jgi:glutaredoxin
MDIQIYTKPNCPYCIKTKQFLEAKNLSYREKTIGIDITSDKFTKMFQSTVPAIFVANNLIGGYDQLVILYSVKPELFVG